MNPRFITIEDNIPPMDKKYIITEDKTSTVGGIIVENESEYH